MNWRTWTLKDWNKALIDEVFLNQEKLDLKVTRISTSNRVLAQCTGDANADGHEAARRFLSCFRASTTRFKTHFTWSNSIIQTTERLGHPSIFAALYVTLLAATADETTFDEGNFRNRFVELFGESVLSSPPSFSDLPKLWEHVATWSRARAQKTADCRILVLPDPQHECLIGYSKRLAFPGYRDEKLLHRVLQDYGVDADSGFNAVAQAVSARQSRFSPSFREEFKIFVALITRARDDESYDSPFWGAIQALTWDENRQIGSQLGVFQFGVDTSDPICPEFYLLVDKTGKETLGSGFTYRDIPMRNQRMFSVTCADAGGWTPPHLMLLVGANRQLRRVPLWKKLAAGCVALFPDPSGFLTLQGEHYDCAPACLIAGASDGGSLAATAKAIGLRFIKIPDESNTWAILLFEELSTKALARLAMELPESARPALQQGGRPSRVTCAGGAWYGQSLHLSPASSPIFRLPGAVLGSYQLLAPNGVVIARGILDIVDPTETDFSFQIPSRFLVDFPPADTLVVTLCNSENLSASETFVLSPDLPISRPVPILNENDWLTDGRSGQLEELGRSPERTTPTPIDLQGVGLRPRLGSAEERNLHCGFERSGLFSNMEPLGWLSEALLLRFQRRSTLTFADFYSHLTPACAASGHQRWQVKKLLLSSGWLVPILRKSSRFQIVTPVRPSIALCGTSQADARIAGMLSRFELNHLASRLRPNESAWRLTRKNEAPGISAIFLKLSSANRIAEIAHELNLEILGRDNSPLLTLLDDPHRRTCATGCYKCLHRFGNQAFHGLLDWRLGLTLLQLLVDGRHQVGLDGDYSSPGIKDWQNLAGKLALEASGLLGRRNENVDGIPLIEIGHGKWAAVLHPLWDWNALLDSSPGLQDWFDKMGEPLLTNTFDLSRRMGDVIHRLRTA